MRFVSPASCGSSVSGAEEVQKSNVELGMICTDENDIEQLNEMYGPLCWQRYDHDLGGYKNVMWYSIMKEFNCKVFSTWSSDDRTKDAASTHRKHGDGGREKLLQLDFIIGPQERHDECCICNEGIITRFTRGFRKEEMPNNSSRKERRIGVAGRPKTVEHNIEVMKKVMENGRHGVTENTR